MQTQTISVIFSDVIGDRISVNNGRVFAMTNAASQVLAYDRQTLVLGALFPCIVGNHKRPSRS